MESGPFVCGETGGIGCSTNQDPYVWNGKEIREKPGPGRFESAETKTNGKKERGYRNYAFLSLFLGRRFW